MVEYSHPDNSKLVSNDKLMQITMMLWPSESSLGSVEALINQLTNIDSDHNNALYHSLLSVLNKLAYNLNCHQTNMDDARYIHQTNQSINQLLEQTKTSIPDELYDVIVNLRLFGLVKAIKAGADDIVPAFIQDLYINSLQRYYIDLNEDFIEAASEQTDVISQRHRQSNFVYNQFLFEKHLFYLAARYGYQLSFTPTYNGILSAFEDVLIHLDQRLYALGIDQYSRHIKPKINSCAAKFAVCNGQVDWVIRLYKELDDLDDYNGNKACPANALLTNSSALFQALRDNNVAMVLAIAALVKRKSELPRSCHSEVELLDQQLKAMPEQLLICPDNQSCLSDEMRSAVQQFSQAQRLNLKSSIFDQNKKHHDKIDFVKRALINGNSYFLRYFIENDHFKLNNKDIQSLFVSLYANKKHDEPDLVRSINDLLIILPKISSGSFQLDEFYAQLYFRVLIRQARSRAIANISQYVDLSSLAQNEGKRLVEESIKLLRSDADGIRYQSKINSTCALLFCLSYYMRHADIVSLFEMAIEERQNRKAIVGILQNYCQYVYDPDGLINSKAKQYSLKPPIHDFQTKPPVQQLLADVNESDTVVTLDSTSSSNYLKALKAMIDDLYHLVETSQTQTKFEVYALLMEIRQVIYANKADLAILSKLYEQAIEQINHLSPKPRSPLLFTDELTDHIHDTILPMLNKRRLELALFRSNEDAIKNITNDMLDQYEWATVRTVMMRVAEWCFKQFNQQPEGLNLFNATTIAQMDIKDLFAIWQIEAEHNQVWFSALAFKHYNLTQNKKNRAFIDEHQPFNDLLKQAFDMGHFLFVFHTVEMLFNNKSATLLQEQYLNPRARENLLTTDNSLYKAIKQGEVGKVECLIGLMNICIDHNGQIYEPFKPLLSDIYELIQNQPHKYSCAALVCDQKNDDLANAMLRLVAQLPLTKSVKTQDIEELPLEAPIIQKLSWLVQGEECNEEAIANNYGVGLIDKALNEGDKDIAADLLHYVECDNMYPHWIPEAIRYNREPALVCQMIKRAKLNDEDYQTIYKQLMGSHYKPWYSGDLLNELLKGQSSRELPVNLQWYAARLAIQNKLRDLLISVLNQVQDQFDSSQLIDLLNEAHKLNDYISMILLLGHTDRYETTPRQELMSYAIANQYTHMLEIMANNFEKSLTPQIKADISQQAQEQGIPITWSTDQASAMSRHPVMDTNQVPEGRDSTEYYDLESNLVGRLSRYTVIGTNQPGPEGYDYTKHYDLAESDFVGSLR